MACSTGRKTNECQPLRSGGCYPAGRDQRAAGAGAVAASRSLQDSDVQRSVARPEAVLHDSQKREAVMLRSCLLALIAGYQRFISPHKGFACAYRVHTGRASCSQLGYRAVRRYGFWKGLVLIRQRTVRCGVAHRRYANHVQPHLHAQRGVCDLSCDVPCDGALHLPQGCDASGCGAHFPSGKNSITCPCPYDCAGCDWPSRRGQSRQSENEIHIPPHQNAAI